MINTVQKYIEELSALPLAQDSTYWFRGQANIDWKLLPKLLRQYPQHPEAIRYEKKCIAKFRSQAVSLMNRVPNDDLEWFFAMQHYGVSTRLLDWTENALTALYFAVTCELPNISNGVVWVLNATELNRAANEQDVVHYSSDSLSNYNHESFAKHGLELIKPLAIHADRGNARMVAQQSTFTIFLQNYTSLEVALQPPNLVKLEIESASKAAIKQQLAGLGIGEFQLFPELAVLGKNL